MNCIKRLTAAAFILLSFFVKANQSIAPPTESSSAQTSSIKLSTSGTSSTTVESGNAVTDDGRQKNTTRISRTTQKQTLRKAATRQKGTSALSSSASASLRRIKKEYKDVVQMGICYDWIKGRLVTSSSTERDSSDVKLIVVGPLATNLRHWHFSFRGVQNSLYESGIYHGRILLPKDYPSSPPRVQVMTPSGRFKTFTDICLSASAYHPESWTPRWTVLSLVHALRLHMLTNPQEIGGTVSSAEDTIEFARRSLTWKFAWMVGNTRVLVDHAKLIEQEALAVSLPSIETQSGDTSNISVVHGENYNTTTSITDAQQTSPVEPRKSTTDLDSHQVQLPPVVQGNVSRNLSGDSKNQNSTLKQIKKTKQVSSVQPISRVQGKASKTSSGKVKHQNPKSKQKKKTKEASSLQPSSSSFTFSKKEEVEDTSIEQRPSPLQREKSLQTYIVAIIRQLFAIRAFRVLFFITMVWFTSRR